MSWKISDNSKTLAQPDNIICDLRRHQLAMFYRCLSIEKNVQKSGFDYGIFSDKAGAGKTAVMISVIVADKLVNGKTSNLIIVPQNIHTQWINEFNKFVAKDFLKVRSFVDYDSITSLYYDRDILKENDVLITTSVYYETIMSIADSYGISIRRIIFDEIDTIYDIIDNLEEKKRLKESKTSKKMKNKIIWFISASFDRCITDKGFKFKDDLIPLTKLDEIMCKCEDGFIDKHNFALEKPEINLHVCDSVADVYFEYLSVIQLDNINSLSYQNVYGEYNNTIGSGEHDVLNIIISDYFAKINSISMSLTSLMKHETNKDLVVKKEKELKFYNNIVNGFHSLGCSNTDCNNIEECIKESISRSIGLLKDTKSKVLDKVLKDVKNDDKILIFSDFTGGFKMVVEKINKLGLKYSDLSGGNIKAISESIYKYKEGDVNLLLVDSSSQGCGLNLENTTKLIFLHKTSEMLFDQIVGRAQRPGRKSMLQIYKLYNKNELV